MHRALVVLLLLPLAGARLGVAAIEQPRLFSRPTGGRWQWVVAARRCVVGCC